MLEQSLLQAALVLTLNLSDDPCSPIKPITISYNEEVYETFPGNQGGRVLQVVEGTVRSQEGSDPWNRFVLIFNEEGSILSFLQKESDGYHSMPWLRGQLNGTLDALSSDNNFQLVRPSYCDLPSFNMMQYDTF